ncbi:hypothetical protein K435DRAFT_968210 [Dendrothele bispora CBS 962.96]|uniref:Mid2 domain-containing protein n=1 Tax=Dendrothele bispora (strain CBS 962.96) TaxID=1314807 RepID=A0A4S8LQA1_DENBC|nr:hypothetical protein K435DRAFT_968210 [Dendrothele bispora CBS 962.96]
MATESMMLVACAAVELSHSIVSTTLVSHLTSRMSQTPSTSYVHLGKSYCFLFSVSFDCPNLLLPERPSNFNTILTILSHALNSITSGTSPSHPVVTSTFIITSSSAITTSIRPSSSPSTGGSSSSVGTSPSSTITESTSVAFTSSATNSSSSHSTSTAPILAGSLIGGIVAFMIITLLGWLCYRRKRLNQTRASPFPFDLNSGNRSSCSTTHSDSIPKPDLDLVAPGGSDVSVSTETNLNPRDVADQPQSPGSSDVPLLSVPQRQRGRVGSSKKKMNYRKDGAQRAKRRGDTSIDYPPAYQP